MSASARDSKGAAIPNVHYETKIEREGPDPSPEPVELYDQGEEAAARLSPPRSSASPAIIPSPRSPARDGNEIGRDKSRFLVYQDDRELENPSADLKLAREIAEITGGELVTSRTTRRYLKGIDRPSTPNT